MLISIRWKHIELEEQKLVIDLLTNRGITPADLEAVRQYAGELNSQGFGIALSDLKNGHLSMERVREVLESRNSLALPSSSSSSTASSTATHHFSEENIDELALELTGMSFDALLKFSESQQASQTSGSSTTSEIDPLALLTQTLDAHATLSLAQMRERGQEIGLALGGTTMTATARTALLTRILAAHTTLSPTQMGEMMVGVSLVWAALI